MGSNKTLAKLANHCAKKQPHMNAQGQQTNLFGFSLGDDKGTKLMNTLDRINNKYHKGTIRLASEGIHKTWVMRRNFKSANYTGDWRELPRVS